MLRLPQLRTDMTLRLDHIVIAVADLDAARADYGRLGFTALPGGEHADGVTHNALVVLADGAYLELIAFRQPAPERRWWRVGHEAGDGFVDYALLPGDIAADVAAASIRGLELEGPVAAGRLRPDGVRLQWQTARSSQPDVPFLCGDVTPRRLRVPEGADIRTHPNGVTGVAALTVAVRDLAASLTRYQAYLGLSAAAVAPPRILAGAGLRVATLPLGSVAVALASPLPGVPSALSDALERRGEGLFGVAFRSEGTAGLLDPALTHGARLEAVGPD